MKSFKLALVATALLTSQAIISEANLQQKSSYDANHKAAIVSIFTEQIIKDSKHGAEIQARMMKEQQLLTASFPAIQEKMKSQESAIMQGQESLNKEAKNFETQAPMLDPEARTRKIDELQEKRANLEEMSAMFQRAVQKFNDDSKKIEQRLMAMYQKEMGTLEQKIRNVVEELAKVHHWDIVVTKESTIFSSSKIDVTSIVINKLDAIFEKELAEKVAAQKAKTTKLADKITKA